MSSVITSRDKVGIFVNFLNISTKTLIKSQTKLALTISKDLYDQLCVRQIIINFKKLLRALYYNLKD